MQAVADSIPHLVQGMRSSQAQPEELGAQLALIIASQSFLQVILSTQSATIKLFVIRQNTHTQKLLLYQFFFCCSFFMSPSLSLEVRW